MGKKRILLIEPYYGGSHRQFLEGLINNLPAEFVLLRLPARKWKMRMQLSAPWFVQKIREMPVTEQYFDTVLFSTFLDGAVFRALVERLAGWNKTCRYLCYFHENQFGYPGYLPKSTVHQFTAINFNTALCADGLAFNSSFNLSTFLFHCRKYLSKAVDMNVMEQVDAFEKKSIVLYPGIDFSLIDNEAGNRSLPYSPLIIWNHRWEHDKNPQHFFEVLYRLQDEGFSFKCAILGQSFKQSPKCFEHAKRRLADNSVQFGFVRGRAQYARLLSAGSIVVSTALHEFFGYAVLEAVRAGCQPLLPDRLSYPELFPKRFLYGEDDLLQRLRSLVIEGCRLTETEREELTGRFSWQVQREKYKNWLELE